MDTKDRIIGKWFPNWEGSFPVIQIFTNGTYEVEELASHSRILRINSKYLKKDKSMLHEIKIDKE